MSARFEIVRTDAGHHVRLLGGNGQVLTSSEVFTRRANAEGNVRATLRAITGQSWDLHWNVAGVEKIAARPGPGDPIEVVIHPLPVLYIDERGVSA